MTDRPTWDEFFLDLAEVYSKRSTCKWAHFGAVIVDPRTHGLVAAGYNNPPRGEPNCFGLAARGVCAKELVNLGTGEGYDVCRAIHAEQNAMLWAGAQACEGKWLYLAAGWLDESRKGWNAPCPLCEKLIIQVGIIKVVCRDGEGEAHIYWPHSWRERL